MRMLSSLCFDPEDFVDPRHYSEIAALVPEAVGPYGGLLIKLYGEDPRLVELKQKLAEFGMSEPTDKDRELLPGEYSIVRFVEWEEKDLDEAPLLQLDPTLSVAEIAKGVEGEAIKLNVDFENLERLHSKSENYLFQSELLILHAGDEELILNDALVDLIRGQTFTGFHRLDTVRVIGSEKGRVRGPIWLLSAAAAIAMPRLSLRTRLASRCGRPNREVDRSDASVALGEKLIYDEASLGALGPFDLAVTRERLVGMRRWIVSQRFRQFAKGHDLPLGWSPVEVVLDVSGVA